MLKNIIKNTVILGLTTMVVTSCATPSTSPNGGVFGSKLGLKALVVTKILSDRTTVTSNLKWSGIGGVDHYELFRKQNGGTEVSIGPSKLTNSTLTYSDSNLKEDSTYEYVVYAIDANNKVISTEKTDALKPINSIDLKAAEILDLKPGMTNTVTRLATLKWSSVPDVDLYYPAITNDSTSKQVFGLFTKNTSININDSTSPENPSDLIKQELPIFTGGVAASIKHKFSVYTIKFNNKEVDKATAIGLRQSQEVDILI